MISTDIAKLTGLSINCINSILTIEQDCICYAVQESLLSKKKYADIDIGIGLLTIYVEDDSIQYKFIPSHSLEEDILSTVNSGEAPMIHRLEDNLKNKILNAYKELL